ncbi:hypothetical protein EV175_002486, partial [Coemansia sp. RSA 1933]
RAKLTAQLGELQQANNEAQEQKAKFNKLHTTFQTLRKQSLSQLEKNKATISDHEVTIQTLNQQINDLRGQLVTGDQDGAVAKLEYEIAALTKDKNDATAAQQQLAENLQQTQHLLEGARAELASAQSATAEATGGGTDMSPEVDQLRQKLAEAEARVGGYETQLQEVKARANKYVRDNKVLQSKAAQLESKVTELQQQTQPGDNVISSSVVEDLQKQLTEAQKQLTESEAKIEAAQANAKKSAELRSKLQISRANKRAIDLEQQVNELQEKIQALESPTSGGAVPLKRTLDSEDTPAKKPHVDETAS